MAERPSALPPAKQGSTAVPDNDNHTRRIHDEAAAIARQSAYIRDLVARSCEILKQPVPDTFLGRRTHEPFPREPSSSPEDER
ncbi:hypothetical protein EAS61_30400 [Bradyrhizobium zhanjiangense]|uniref:Uncharacterized protein n=1 Tax=Bradyrhizobium zhanjiangense TaxID=1325107 RepID=A0A4Q0QCU2_9BRAD|nr:hypothetical protein EAS61_30400 [Bradyrhizobium zhanjiangense]